MFDNVLRSLIHWRVALVEKPPGFPFGFGSRTHTQLGVQSEPAINGLNSMSLTKNCWRKIMEPTYLQTSNHVTWGHQNQWPRLAARPRWRPCCGTRRMKRRWGKMSSSRCNAAATWCEEGGKFKCEVKMQKYGDFGCTIILAQNSCLKKYVFGLVKCGAIIHDPQFLLQRLLCLGQ